MTSQSDPSSNKKSTFPWSIVYFVRSRDLYRVCRLAVLRIISSGMGLHHQRPARLLLCLGSLETGEANNRGGATSETIARR